MWSGIVKIDFGPTRILNFEINFPWDIVSEEFRITNAWETTNEYLCDFFLTFLLYINTHIYIYTSLKTTKDTYMFMNPYNNIAK